MDLYDILDQCPKNEVIRDNFIKAYKIINDKKYEKILCSISGGADSDVMLDICHKCDNDNKIMYVWFNTGLEYQATKDHLDYLEERYSITIHRTRAKIPIPLSCHKYGQPFISKRVSEMMMRLQRYDFEWEDRDFESLCVEYPKCKAALRWWCNEWGDDSHFNISRNRYLKEFIIENPPQFKISNMCCQHAKKDVIKNLAKEYGADLNIYGVRKAEGGGKKHGC